MFLQILWKNQKHWVSLTNDIPVKFKSWHIHDIAAYDKVTDNSSLRALPTAGQSAVCHPLTHAVCSNVV